jgi:predicted permease
VFSVVSGVLLEPLPYPEPDRLVRVYDENPNFPRFPLAPAAFNDYRELELPFSGFATFNRGNLQLSDDDRPEQLTGMRVSSGFFQVLGMEPVLGRGFTREQELEGNHYQVVLGYQLWQRRFNGDASVLGRTLELSGRTFTVVGVAHPDLQSPGGSFRSVSHGEAVDLWWPLVLGPAEQPRNSHYLNGVARLRNGVSLEQAEAAMSIIAADVFAPFVDPEDEGDAWTIDLVALSEDVVGQARSTLLVLLGAASLILLMACVNMAGVMLARAAERQGEIALRMAIGASRGHLIRQMLVEGAVVAVLGGLVGVVLGVVGLGQLLGLAPEGLPRVYAIGLDARVLSLAVGATAVTALAAGLVPAFHTRNFEVAGTLQADGGRAIRSAVRSRRVLVVSQVALAVVILVGAGLLLRSLVGLQHVDPGFRPDGVLTARLGLPSARYSSAQDRAGFYRELEMRLAGLPGVQATGVSYALPWNGYDENSGFEIEGWEPPEDLLMSLRYHFVGADFLEAIGVPLLEGRGLRYSDDGSPDSPPVALINEAMARLFWREQPGAGNPLGSQIHFWGQVVTVVGIVGNVKDGPSSAETRPAAFFPILQFPRSSASVAIQTRGDPMSIVGSLREVVASIDPALPLADVRLLSEIAGATTAPARFTVLLVGMFAAMALALAVVGLYGLLSYLVGQRSQEIAVRMALGAASGRVLRLVVTEGVLLTAFGLVLGIAAGLALARLLASLLFGITPFDPLTLVGVALAVLLVAGASCLLPAMRAARVEPARAMR